MKAIQTTFKGYKFRSRTEARWAIFFDSLGLQWEYEPEGFDLGNGVYYLPDFKVFYPGREGSGSNETYWRWFEVKSDLGAITPDEWLKMALFAKSQPYFFILDGPPSLRTYLPFGWVFGLGSEDENGDFREAPMLSHPTPRMIEDAKRADRQGVVLWCDKERPWWGCGDISSFDENDRDVVDSILGSDGFDEIVKAVSDARSYRFGKDGRA